MSRRMRNRETIERTQVSGIAYSASTDKRVELMLEVLLDIRDLLMEQRALEEQRERVWEARRG